MRQVPRYTIIGSGRVARHFAHYFHLLDIPCRQWSRQTDPEEKNVSAVIEDADIILILISDPAIESFIQHHSLLQNKTCIHFSGCLVTPLAHGTHPLMTFSNELYDLETYRQMAFISEQGGPEFKLLFPHLNNPHFVIPPAMKAFYHSLCVLSGNFTCLLWQKLFTELEHRLKIPKEAAYPYLKQIAGNLSAYPDQALTGPLARGDKATIAAHLNVLADDPFKKIYQAFVEVYAAMQNKENNS
jgi:predicted short-subunit dehydrogenase-like oxidoreductase (DUF2520 family)